MTLVIAALIDFVVVTLCFLNQEESKVQGKSIVFQKQHLSCKRLLYLSLPVSPHESPHP